MADETQQAAPMPDLPTGDEQDQAKQVEYRLVQKLLREYKEARKFDREARKQYAVDRRYASGTADLTWAVTTNLIGTFIDILKAYLYARDPDVGCRPAEHVPPDLMAREEQVRTRITAEVEQGAALMAQQTGMQAPPELVMQQIETRVQKELRAIEQRERKQKADMDAFAKTMQIVVSRLWKRAGLKKAVRKAVRSALSCGPGWLKVVMVIDKKRDPQVEAALNDAQDNLARIRAAQAKLAEGEVDDKEQAAKELELQIQGLQAKVEVIVRKGLAIDFCSAEDVQVSLDVRELSDYLEAGWMANAIYRPKSELREMFPKLTEEQAKQATCYYQRKPPAMDPKQGTVNEVSYRDADQFDTDGAVEGYGTTATDEAPVEFCKIIEIWDRRDNLIKTIVDGIPCFVKDPYPPPQASTRFYPYFLLALYETDGSRHPQSLSWRLRKLQDEYSSTRSSFRLNRQRSLPGTVFNAEQVDPTNAQKLEKGVEQEFIGIKLTNPNADIRTVFTEKPVARMDPLVYNTEPITADMEKISGVQEALQSSAQPTKTATEAEIQQSGFAARTSADRDCVEEMLDDIAQYTAEIALQAITLPEAQRIAGPNAFWPHGMDIEDLLTMVEIDIVAGSTGRPNTNADREAWSTAMPLIMQVMEKIQAAQAMGNEPLARAMKEVLRETLARLGDRIDVERFLPELPAMAAQAPVPMGGAPAPGGGPLPPAQPNQPPGAPPQPDAAQDPLANAPADPLQPAAA